MFKNSKKQLKQHNKRKTLRKKLSEYSDPTFYIKHIKSIFLIDLTEEEQDIFWLPVVLPI